MWKTALGVVLLVVSLSGASAQTRIEVNLHWITDSNGCKIWDTLPSGNERVTWSGGCKDGYAEGKGTLTWYVNGRRHGLYEGELQGGHYAGRGTQVWSTGARYEGEWQEDRAEGQGTYRAADGEICSGVWRDGCFQGKCGWTVGNPQCPAK